jgi:L-rhamnose-H+ transport protein
MMEKEFIYLEECPICRGAGFVTSEGGWNVQVECNDCSAHTVYVEYSNEEEKKEAVKDFNFPKGLAIALLAGFMSGCFNVGLEFGKDLNFGELTNPMFRTLPATLLVTIGGFITNAVYCLYQNGRNKTFSDYKQGRVWGNNLLFCALAGLLWYSQFFGLSLGRSFFAAGSAMDTLAFCILMALNVTFSNVWGIILKEWKGCSRKTIVVLIAGIAVLILSSFLPELLK